MGLGLTYFALEGGVSGRSSIKIEGKGNSEMTLLFAYITLKMQLPCPLASPLPFPSTSIPCLQR